MTEVLTKYGPVNRLWFDGVNTGVVQKDMQSEAVYKPYYDSVFKMIREISPETLISAYRFVRCISCLDFSIPMRPILLASLVWQG